MSSPIQPPLTVETVDGTTSGRPITKIKVTNGDLTISGSTATIDTSGGGGGGGTVTSVGTSQAFITITNPTTTPSISIGNASGSATGVLTASDWTTFNSKTSNVGTVTSITAGDGLSGGTITSSGTISIPTQGGLSAGSYTNTSITVDARGIITAISNGTGASPGGSDTQVQFNNSGSFDGNNKMTYAAASGVLTLTNYATFNNIQVGFNAGVITTNNAGNMTLQPFYGINAGDIVIGGTSNSNITISPHGTGEVHLGNFKFDVDQSVGAGQDNYVLTYDNSTDLISLEAAGGGSITFPIEADSGSAGVPSYSFSADTDTGIYLSGASNMGIVAAGNSYLQIGSLGAVQFDRKALFNVATAAAPNAFSTDTNTGFFQAAADTISLSNAGSETFRFGSSGEILIGGSAAGTSGQVLTSGGSGSAVTWGSAGGITAGEDTILGNPTAMDSTSRAFNTNFRIGGGSYTSDMSVEYTQISLYPFIAPHTATVNQVTIEVATAASGRKLLFGIYDSDSTSGLPDSKVAECEFSMASTGQVTQTSFTGTPSLTRGKVYWAAHISDDNSSGSGNVKGRENNPAFAAPSSIPIGRSIGASFGNAPPNTCTVTAGAGAQTLPASITADDIIGASRDLAHFVLEW